MKRHVCVTCGNRVHRSWKTGILWKRCRACRYLIFLYGPSIIVKWRKS